MPRLAKARQTALDQLDLSCPADHIDSRFLPSVRVAFDHIPNACHCAVARVAAVLARHDKNREVPAGYGAELVRHFYRRSQQLAPIKRSIESRFALIELALSASLANGWMKVPPLTTKLTTKESHRTCVRHVVQQVSDRDVELESWRRVLEVVLRSEDSTLEVIRNIACALVWCGSFSPEYRSMMTDEYLARVFGTTRTEFVRFRLEALRWLPWLLEFSLRPSAGGVP